MSGLLNILKKVQISKASHQKQLKILEQYYNEVPLESFFDDIQKALKKLFTSSNIPSKNPYIERTLEFLAQFVANVTPDDIEEEVNNFHPFLTMVIKETLKYNDEVAESIRYKSCLFVRLILQHIGSNKNLDNEVCDFIEEAMLERTLDPKSVVRLEAVLAMIRLQDLSNIESPVNKAYLSLIIDGNCQIRAEVVRIIAPYNLSIPQIVNRLRDVDGNVRIAALRRCADLGPKTFKILERQQILLCGVTDVNPKAKNVFVENLLPKWLNVYQNDYISFINALKLDADENDFTNTENIIRDVLNLLLRSIPIDDVVSNLNLDENKVIPMNKLSSEAVILWNILVHYLRDIENLEDYLENAIPELTPFCNYIESIVNGKEKNNMEDWQYLEYQYMLINLFGIAGGYDVADEVGRKTLYQLTQKLLMQENLIPNLIEKILQLAAKTAPKNDDFTSVVCHIISEIQEPMVETQVETNPVEETDKECRKAELRVKIIRLESDLEDATDNQEYLKANAIKNEMNELKAQLQELSIVKEITEMISETKDDSKTLCTCLDILNSMLILPSINTMTPSLRTVRDELVVPLLNSNVGEINWRVLKCIALFCILDASFAKEYLKVLCIPIITYRAIANYNKQAMMISVKAVCDLFRIYGANIFGTMEVAISSNSNQSLNSTNSQRRRLYTTEDSEEMVSLTKKFHLESIMDVILDMLDDEISDIRNIAIEAISKLILNGFPVSAPLITRLILKWYNPLTAQTSDKSQQLIGLVLTNFARGNQGAKEEIAKAVILTLQSIASAPNNSPLADVDIDNLLLFFSSITGFDEQMDICSTHMNMAHLFACEILKRKNNLIAVYLSKLLVYLNVSTGNVTALKELITQMNTALEDESLPEKAIKRNLLKFRENLISIIKNTSRPNDTNIETTENSNIINEENKENESTSNARNRKELNSTDKDVTAHVTIANLSSINEEEEDLFDTTKDKSNTTVHKSQNSDIQSNPEQCNSKNNGETSNESIINESTEDSGTERDRINESAKETEQNNHSGVQNNSNKADSENANETVHKESEESSEKKRRRKHEIENKNDAEVIETTKRSSKRLKLQSDIVEGDKNGIKSQIDCKQTSKTLQVVIHRWNEISEESHESSANSEENIISATPESEDLNISKGKPRKRSLREPSKGLADESSSEMEDNSRYGKRRKKQRVNPEKTDVTSADTDDNYAVAKRKSKYLDLPVNKNIHENNSKRIASRSLRITKKNYLSDTYESNSDVHNVKNNDKRQIQRNIKGYRDKSLDVDKNKRLKLQMNILEEIKDITKRRKVRNGAAETEENQTNNTRNLRGGTPNMQQLLPRSRQTRSVTSKSTSNSASGRSNTSTDFSIQTSSSEDSQISRNLRSSYGEKPVPELTSKPLNLEEGKRPTRNTKKKHH